MVGIKTITSILNRKALGGAKIPHSVSNPVLRVVDNSLYIAAFVYTYNRENLQQNKMPRPVRWIISDINSGDIIKEFDCREDDYTDASFGELYDLNDPGVKRPTKEDFVEIYALFDSVRTDYVEKGVRDTETYKKYFDKILEITPSSYRKFYIDLSNF